MLNILAAIGLYKCLRFFALTKIAGIYDAQTFPNLPYFAKFITISLRGYK